MLAKMLTNTPLQRRRTLKTLLALPSALVLPLNAKKHDEDVLYAGASYRSAEHRAQQFGLVRFSPTTGKRQVIETAFFPHALALSPKNPLQCLAFEKIGPGAALLDLKSGAMQSPILARPGKLFYGHGTYSRDGRFFYCTESSLDGLSGSIGVFDAQTLRAVGELASFGIRPHDLQLTKDGKTLIVTNGGGSQSSRERGSLCWIDARSGKLLRRLHVNHERMNAGHFQISSDLAVVVSAPRAGLDASDLGGVHVSSDGSSQSGDLNHLERPENFANRLIGESLSVLMVPHRKRFYVSHPGPGLVSAWHLENQALEQIFEFPRARGLALSRDGQTLFVSHDAQAHLSSIRLVPGAQDVVRTTRQENTLLAGSHLFNWPRF